MSRRFWKAIWMTAAGLGPVLSPAPGHADSIWARRDQRSAYLFTDNRAHNVGDLLTVVVREVTGTKNNEERKLNKDTGASGKFGFAGKTGSNGAERSALADLSANQSSDRKFQGSSEYDSDRSFIDQMSLTVVDVLPNGNLVVEGFRKRVVANESRLLRVSGVVRPYDIGLGNIVESRFIANFNVAYEGNGVESRFTNQGWLGRMGNRIWPF